MNPVTAPAMSQPMSGATVDKLAATIAAETTIAGIGESTRFAHQTFSVRDLIFRSLAQHHGFRALFLQDNATVAAKLDAYVTGTAGTAASALDGAWRPWRTSEMAAALDWIREFNQGHPDDPVRIFGVKPTQAQPADYDAVLDYVRRSAPHRLAEVEAHLEPIRTAHDIDEHVQSARGLHPGRPFADHARDALDIVQSLSGVSPDTSVVERICRIVLYHESSVAGRGSYAGDAEVWAGTIWEYQQRTGARVAYWDGISHTSAAPAILGLAPERGPQPSVGSVLRQHYGARYVAVAIGFHHGDLGAVTIPEPARDLIDAELGELGQPAHWVDLRPSDARARWDRPAKVRVVSGVYDVSRDAAEHMAVASLADAFDVLIHIRGVTPVAWLP
jgi:erythromycin esterase